MALMQVALSRKIREKNLALEPLREARAALETRAIQMKTRETELENAVNEMPDEVETAVKEAVEAEIAQFEADAEQLKAETEANAADIARIETEIGEIEQKLSELQAEPEPAPEPAQNTEPTNRNERMMENMEIRSFRALSYAEQRAIAEKPEVKAFIGNVRALKGGSARAIGNVELSIPQILLPMIRAQVEEASKLYKHVNVQYVPGTSRAVIAPDTVEAIWTEQCANLNELAANLYGVELDGYKVGGYIAVCNAVLEDNDVGLVDYIIYIIGRAIGRALDKAILYGTDVKMPLGIVPRLVQTQAPSDAAPNAYPWQNLSATNVISISSANSTGTNLFKELLKGMGRAKNDFGFSGFFCAMNRVTRAAVVAESLGVNSAGAIVAGMDNNMPVVGGAIEELDFIPDNVIIAGFGGAYLLVERAGTSIGQSEHARYIEDQTVFKGTARYDGAPVIPEAFVAIALNGGTVSGTGATFLPDEANEGE